jgi:hypothetical protein
MDVSDAHKQSVYARSFIKLSDTVSTKIIEDVCGCVRHPQAICIGKNFYTGVRHRAHFNTLQIPKAPSV